VVVAPELALTGYPPEDLLLRPAFMQACAQALGLALELADCEGCMWWWAIRISWASAGRC
jgi:NAD+ synthase (glutamine-hydrolysing)